MSRCIAEHIMPMSENKKADNDKNLFLIKLTHTAIWCIFVAAILYVLYAGIFNRVGILAWICIGLVFIEGIILLIYNGKCPLTLLGHKYTDNPMVGFDIFLPVWLAKYNKAIFSALFMIGFVLVIWRVL